jgi:hypothetical protein
MDSCVTEQEQARKGTARKRREATRQTENLFFEMSRPVESPEMLKSWVEWFRRLHIPCAIAKTEGGYTLWRKGKEVGRRRSKAPVLLIKENIIFSFGLTARELDLLKEQQQARAFRDIALSRWKGPPSHTTHKVGIAENHERQ